MLCCGLAAVNLFFSSKRNKRGFRVGTYVNLIASAWKIAQPLFRPSCFFFFFAGLAVGTQGVSLSLHMPVPATFSVSAASPFSTTPTCALSASVFASFAGHYGAHFAHRQKTFLSARYTIRSHDGPASA